MKCQNCGNEIETNQPRCPYCGTPIETTLLQKRKWYQSAAFTIVMLVFFWPVGLFLMWKYQKQWKKSVKILISIVFAIAVIGSLASPSSDDSKKEPTKMETEKEPKAKKEEKKAKDHTTKEAAETEPVIEPEPAPAEEPEPRPVQEEPELTLGQKNALSSAKNYLSFMAFSYTGLISQLEYEGYTTEEATYAADNCGADWYAQAVASAENYLKYMSFSRQGLIDQLIYEGYTQDQAENAATAVGY